LGLGGGGIIGLFIASGRLGAMVVAGVALGVGMIFFAAASVTPGLVGRWMHPTDGRYERTMRYTFPSAIRAQFDAGSAPWSVRTRWSAPAAALVTGGCVLVLAATLRLSI
jgi:hypothetical protein